MKKKIIGIFLCMLLISTALPVYGAVSVNESKTIMIEEGTQEVKKLSMSPGTHFKFMFFDKGIRSYRLHIPPDYDGTKPMPLVFAYHGCPSSSFVMMAMTALNKKSDEEGFIVVYPNGNLDIPYILFWIKELGVINRLLLGLRYWNFWDFIDVDDVGYFQALIEKLQTTLNINSSRIYVTGHSGGGFMSYRLGAEFSDIIAAIAPAAGTIGGRTWYRYKDVDPKELELYIIPEPENPLPVIVFHGMNDPAVPYEGLIWEGTILYLSVNESVEFWVENNGCDPVPEVNISESGNIITRTYTNGSNGTEVVLYTVADGGHDWFGGPEFIWPPCEISINDLIWEFFEKHPKQ